MTNEALFDDLKQFITATVSQSEERLRTDMATDLEGVEQRLTTRMDGLDKKLDDVQRYIANAMDTVNEDNGKTLKDHERRITRLEHRHA